MKTRHYDAVDMDLIFEAPMRWSDAHMAQLGLCRNWMRLEMAAQAGTPTYRTNMEIHKLLIVAHKAYIRETQQSPWDDQHDRYPEVCHATSGGPLVGNTVRERLLCYFVRNGQSARKDAMGAVVAMGHVLKTVSRAVDDMQAEGLIDRKETRGVYDASAQGKRAFQDVLKKLAEQESP